MNSYWINSEKNKEKYNKVEKNIETDICIIGGGITGISTAYYLTKENLKVTVLDMGKIGESASILQPQRRNETAPHGARAGTTEMPKIERSKAPLLLEVRDEETNETRNKNRRTRRNVPHRMDSKDGHTEPAVLPLLLS